MAREMAKPPTAPTLAPIKLGDVTLDIDYFLKTDYQGALAASREIPSVIEWVASELQIAIEKKVVTKQQLKKAEGAAFLGLRGPLWEQRGYAGKQTESAIEAAIHQEKDVVDAHENFAYWSGLVSRLHNTLLSLQSKLDLVRTTEATRRVIAEEDPSQGD